MENVEKKRRSVLERVGVYDRKSISKKKMCTRWGEVYGLGTLAPMKRQEAEIGVTEMEKVEVPFCE